MPVYQTVLIYAGIPLLVVLLFAVLTLPGGRRKPRWKSGQPWEHEPVWYEPHPAAGTRTGGGDAHGVDDAGGHAALGAGTTRAALPAGEDLHARATAAGPLGGARGPGDPHPRPADLHPDDQPGRAAPMTIQRDAYVDGTHDTREAVVDEPRPDAFFSYQDLARLDEALTMASRETGLRFTLYLGDLGRRTRARAEELFVQSGDRLPDSVLVAVSPGQRVVEVVTGAAASRRLPDRACALAVLAMTNTFAASDLVGGIVNGLRQLSDQAGHPPHHRAAH